MTKVAVAILVVLHVMTSVIGPLAVVATGVAAHLLGRAGLSLTTSPASSRPLQRYFGAGPIWASRSLILIPLLGAGIEALHHFDDIGRLWPWLAFGMWALATALAVAVHWPAEKAIRAGLVPAGDWEVVMRACKRAVRSSLVITLLFVGCIGVMVTQPR